MDFLCTHKPTSPQLNSKPENVLIDHNGLMAEIELMDTYNNFVQTLGNDISRDSYRALAEIYAIEYDNHFQDMSTLVVVEGIIVEMYSDIFRHEKKNGESEKTKKLKDRILLLKDGFENLKKYYSKYDEMKLMLKLSAIERVRLLRENTELKQQIENIGNAENF